MKLIYCVPALFLLILTQTGCDERERVKGSGHVASETRKVGDYHAVKADGPMDIIFTNGPLQDVEIEADDNILPLITTEVNDGRLIVDLKDGIRIRHNKQIKVKVTAPDVDAITLAGSGNMIITNEWEHSSPIKLSLSGSGNVEGTVNSPGVSVSVSGSGDVKLKGETRDLNIVVSGSGDYDGYDLHTENSTLNISGAGNAEVHASVNLDVKVSGAGEIRYHGNPHVTSSISGAGSVKKSD